MDTPFDPRVLSSVLALRRRDLEFSALNELKRKRERFFLHLVDIFLSPEIPFIEAEDIYGVHLVDRFGERHPLITFLMNQGFFGLKIQVGGM